jgi:membrane associated rhomboid family serine protease
MIPLRDENPTRTFPFVTILFIAANAAVFVYQATLGPATEQFVLQLAAIPYEVTHFRNLPESSLLPPLLTVATSMFVHGGFMHIVGNMLFLWIFGNSIEDFLGHFRFIVFYLICGLVAAGLQIVLTPSSTTPMVGASGAISGVMGAYLLLYPNARIVTLIFLGFFIRIVRIPAHFFLIFWFLLQLANGFFIAGAPDNGGVAFFAHIGGFAAGLVFVRVFEQRHRLRRRKW